MWWMIVFSYKYYQPIIDFGNKKNDSFFVSFVNITGKLRFYYNNNGKDMQICTSDKIRIGEWAHVALTYKKTHLQLFINNSSEIDRKTNGPIPGLNREILSSYIGKQSWNSRTLEASLDELKVFDRALSIKEINREKEKVEELNLAVLLFILHHQLSTTTGLVHYWPMAGSLRDIVGGKDIVIKTNVTFTNDRFLNVKSGNLFLRFL